MVLGISAYEEPQDNRKVSICRCGVTDWMENDECDTCYRSRKKGMQWDEVLGEWFDPNADEMLSDDDIEEMAKAVEAAAKNVRIPRPVSIGHLSRSNFRMPLWLELFDVTEQW